MAYITEEDYLPQLRLELRDRISPSAGVWFETAMYEAMALAESYLRVRYDVATEFQQGGGDRNEALVQKMVDIIIYDVYSRVAPNQIPAHRQTRYENALRWLEMVADGKLSPVLPMYAPATDGTPSAGGMMMGSDTRFNT